MIAIDSHAELEAALNSAKGGETLVLAPGSYGVLTAGGERVFQVQRRKFAKPVTITSADPSRMAHFDLVNVFEVENLTFRSIDFGYKLAPGTPNYGHMVNVGKSVGITFEGVKVHGPVDGDPTNDRNGIGVLNSDRVTVTGSEFFELNRSIQMGTTSNIKVAGNHFHDLRLGGVHFAGAQHIEISGNRFENFFPIGEDHPDAIQFWEAGVDRDSIDILIKDNLILQGRGRPVQGIFLGDDGDDRTFRDVRIVNNLIYILGWTGIAIEGRSENVVVEGNTAVSPPGDQYTNRIHLQQVVNGVVRNNVADELLEDGIISAEISGNVLLKNSPGRAAELRGLGLNVPVTPESLTIPGVGFQVPVRAATPAPLATSAKAEVQRLARDARDQVNAAENALGRALHRMQKLDEAIERLPG